MTKPRNPKAEELLALTAQLNAAVEAYANGQVDDSDEIAKKCAVLLHRSEDPAVFAERLRYSPLDICAIMIAIEAGALQALAKRPGQVTTAEQLAEICNRPQDNLVRCFRLLTAIGVCDEVGPQQYTPNDKTAFVATPGQIGGFRTCSGVTGPAIGHIETYFSHVASGSIDPVQTSLYAMMHGRPMYDDLKTNGLRADFDAYMEARKHEKKRCWHTVFPAKSVLAAERTTATIVDVAGSHGHDLITFQQDMPDFTGRLVLQDLPEVIQNVPKEFSGQFETMEHDFFKAQPIRDAKIYLLFAVIHNWNDQACMKILKNIAAAMKPGYSRLVFSAMMLPDVGATRRQGELDLQMWVLLGARQRTEKETRGLLAAAGLEIVEIYGERDRECIIEAWLPGP